MITKATDKQWEEIGKLRERVLASITDQPSDEEIRQVVRDMWKRLGYEPKAILIADCPTSGAMMLGWTKRLLEMVNEEKDKKDGAEEPFDLGASLRAGISADLRCELNEQVAESKRDQLLAFFGQLFSQLWDVGEKVDLAVAAGLSPAVEGLSSEVSGRILGNLEDQASREVDVSLRNQLFQSEQPIREAIRSLETLLFQSLVYKVTDDISHTIDEILSAKHGQTDAEIGMKFTQQMGGLVDDSVQVASILRQANGNGNLADGIREKLAATLVELRAVVHESTHSLTVALRSKLADKIADPLLAVLIDTIADNATNRAKLSSEVGRIADEISLEVTKQLSQEVLFGLNALRLGESLFGLGTGLTVRAGIAVASLRNDLSGQLGKELRFGSSNELDLELFQPISEAINGGIDSPLSQVIVKGINELRDDVMETVNRKLNAELSVDFRDEFADKARAELSKALDSELFINASRAIYLQLVEQLDDKLGKETFDRLSGEGGIKMAFKIDNELGNAAMTANQAVGDGIRDLSNNPMIRAISEHLLATMRGQLLGTLGGIGKQIFDQVDKDVEVAVEKLKEAKKEDANVDLEVDRELGAIWQKVRQRVYEQATTEVDKDLYDRFLATVEASVSELVTKLDDEIFERLKAIGKTPEEPVKLDESVTNLNRELGKQTLEQVEAALRTETRNKVLGATLDEALIQQVDSRMQDALRNVLKDFDTDADVRTKLTSEVRGTSQSFIGSIRRTLGVALDRSLELALFQKIRSLLDVQIDGRLEDSRETVETKLRESFEVDASVAEELSDHLHDKVNSPIREEMRSQLTDEDGNRLLRCIFSRLRVRLNVTLDTMIRSWSDGGLGRNVNTLLDQITNELDAEKVEQLDMDVHLNLILALDDLFNSRTQQRLNALISTILVEKLAGVEFGKSVNQMLGDEVLNELVISLHQTVRQQLEDLSLGLDRLFGRSGLHPGWRISSALSARLRARIAAPFDEKLIEQIRSQLYVSIGWRAWSGWYEGAEILGVKFDPEKFDLFKRWTKCVPVIYANAAIPVVIRFPRRVDWKEGALHRDSGPAVEFRGGWGLWVLDGITVDEQIVMRPETQTVEQIDREQNGDVRAIRIQRFGWPRYLAESGAEELDARHNDIEGTEEALFRCTDGSRRLVVTCPTNRIFALGVPETVQTCAQAQDWLAGGRNFRVIART